MAKKKAEIKVLPTPLNAKLMKAIEAESSRSSSTVTPVESVDDSLVKLATGEMHGEKPTQVTKETKTPKNTGGGGNCGDGPTWSWPKFFEGLTFIRAVFLLLSFLGLGAIFWGISNDIQPNKTEIQKRFFDLQNAQQKTKQIETLASSSGTSIDPPMSTTPSVAKTFVSPQPSYDCTRLTDLSAGSFLLAKGHCISTPAAQYSFGLATESPIISISGADFIIEDEQAMKCDSASTSDRCASWLREHQILGRGDSRYGIPRYWFSLKPEGEITINTVR